MGIGLSKQRIFYFKKKKTHLTNNLGYGEIPCLESFRNYCTVFISLGKVGVFCFSFCGLKRWQEV